MGVLAAYVPSALVRPPAAAAAENPWAHAVEGAFATLDGSGMYLAYADGGVSTVGNARNLGDATGLHLNGPVLSGTASSGVEVSGSSTSGEADWSGWLDAAEDLGRLALDEDAPPERMMPPPFPWSPAFTGETACVWWTDGGPRVESARLTMPSLPDAACFASMLGYLAPAESAS